MSEDLPRRLRYYEVTAQALLMHLTTGNAVSVVDGVPEGAVIADAGYIWEKRGFYLTVEHEDFDLVHEGEEIPMGRVTFENLEIEHNGE